MNPTLGSGKVHFDKFSGVPASYAEWAAGRTGERYLGITSELNLNVASSSVEHFDTDNGVAVKDDSALISLTRKAAFKGSDISKENAAMFLIGLDSTQTQTSGAITASVVNGGVALVGDRYYQIGEGSTNPTGVRDITAVSLKTGATTYVAGTDYTIDLTLGRFYVPAGSPMIAAIVTADYTKTATSRIQVVSSTLATVAGSMRFVAVNVRGRNRDVYIPSATITPNGDWSLKGNTYQEMGFDVEINQITGLSHIYIDGRPGDLT